MRFSTAIAASVLAIVSSISAAPAPPKATSDKPFKFQIKTMHGTPEGKTYYLSSSGVTPSVSEAVDCTIDASTKLSCGGMGLTYTAGHTFDFQSLALVSRAKASAGFSIVANNHIQWKTGDGVINISTHSSAPTKVFSEVCNGQRHGDKEGGMNGFVPSELVAVFA